MKRAELKRAIELLVRAEVHWKALELSGSGTARMAEAAHICAGARDAIDAALLRVIREGLEQH